MWSASEGALWFVDIKGHKVHRFDPRTQEGTSWPTPEPAGFIVPTNSGAFICGLKSGLHQFDPHTGSFELLTTVEPSRPRNRINDACVDVKGRLWFGSMDDAETEATGHLYRMTKAGPVACDGPYVVTNGPAVSPDARTLYHIDTFGQTVYAFDIAGDGTLSNKRVFVRIEEANVWPDGPVTDAEGCIWIALWGGWAVNRYDPRGHLIGGVRLPCANITKAAFGGSDFRTMYITSASNGLTEEERAAQPLAGGLFAITVGTPGLPQQTVGEFV